LLFLLSIAESVKSLFIHHASSLHRFAGRHSRKVMPEQQAQAAQHLNLPYPWNRAEVMQSCCMDFQNLRLFIVFPLDAN
jgi:hypothetical protein